ncbi:Atp-dependent rna helicase protein [Thalictrum thalictroides]|uniref:RNA helicase n=1 Tax=Thalictrum thalictroides TaxID=46969 RepID=A0A7J6VDA6_THATH|nr:Atp-dependent rna helicase protein [Thalictrum thalictroides]
MAQGQLNNSTKTRKRNFSEHSRSSYAKRQKLLQHRASLPIASVEKLLVKEVQKHDTLIIVGETGSGKSTQLPQFLYNAGFCGNGKLVGVTQPRRVGTLSVAKRVAEECDVVLGEKVGYSIRFEDVTSTSTRIKYMTDGLLLREALLDPYLSRYAVIIVDEAHERTVHTDVLLGLLKSVQNARSKFGNNDKQLEKENAAQCFGFRKHFQGRSPLKLIIMSASLDAQMFSQYFGGARAVHIQGRQFPVDVLYTYHPQQNYLDASLTTIFQIHLEEDPGDILVFLTGQEEIESGERLIKERLKQLPENSKKLLVVPIFSSLPSERQMRVLVPAPPGFRKVILATNIAETSVTIPGIKYVIDPGFVKARFYDPNKRLESLTVIPISKAQALQRSGRAGREGPGKCFRLYPENDFEKLEDSPKPEIKRCSLSNIILQLKALGVDDVIGFDFIEKPSRQSFVKSLEELILLGALTDEFKLSNPVGRHMACLPLDPIYSKALILSSEFNCLEEMLIAVAMLSVKSLFYISSEKLDEVRTVYKCFESPEGDHLTLINVYRASNEVFKKWSTLRTEDNYKIFRKWCKENLIDSGSLRHAHDIHSQLRRSVEQMGLRVASCGDDLLQFRRCLAAAFFCNVALKQPNGKYRTLANDPMNDIQIHPCSSLFQGKPECIVFDELVVTNKPYLRNATIIDYLWLAELAPQMYSLEN